MANDKNGGQKAADTPKPKGRPPLQQVGEQLAKAEQAALDKKSKE